MGFTDMPAGSGGHRNASDSIAWRTRFSVGTTGFSQTLRAWFLSMSNRGGVRRGIVAMAVVAMVTLSACTVGTPTGGVQSSPSAGPTTATSTASPSTAPPTVTPSTPTPQTTVTVAGSLPSGPDLGVAYYEGRIYKCPGAVDIGNPRPVAVVRA